MRAFATLLAFAASALAYQVTEPTNSTGFSNDGSNTVSWDMVSSDPANFTIVLVNNNIFPNYEQVLDALVVGSLGTIDVNPPSTGWPSGSGYQINFVASSQQLNSILAQSNDFTFHAPTSSSGSVSGSSSVSGASSSTAPSSASTTGLTVSANPASVTSGASKSSASSGASAGASNSGSSDSLNPSSSDTSTTPAATNAAAPVGVQAAFFGVVALVGALLT